MTQKETQEEISKCDIYIDELLGGGYGVSAIESMAFENLQSHGLWNQ